MLINGRSLTERGVCQKVTEVEGTEYLLKLVSPSSPIRYHKIHFSAYQKWEPNY